MKRDRPQGAGRAQEPPREDGHVASAHGGPHISEDPDALGNVGHPVAGSARSRRHARALESDEDMG